MFVQTKWYVARGIKLDFKRLENLHLTNNTKPQSSDLSEQEGATDTIRLFLR